MQRRCRDHRVDTATAGWLHRLRTTIDVFWVRARQSGDDGVLAALRDFVDGLEIALRRNRETGLDDIDAHGVEQLGDLDLLFVSHCGAGTLLTVAQGRVEDDDAILLGLSGGHGLDPSWVRSVALCLTIAPIMSAQGLVKTP